MKLFYAHYPALEAEFVRYVSQQRKNAVEPWLVVCASSFIASRLSSVLAAQNGVVANIHFVTGSAVLHALDSEAGPELPLFPQDHLRDFLLKEILTEPGLDRYPLSPGFVQALKNSLRDLADSLAEPDLIEEHLQTSSDPLLEQDRERLEWLLRVYRRYLQREAQISGYRTYQAYFERALAQVETSSYLKGFSRIIWYGFYDMPGRQLELVNQLKAHYEITVFAPYAPYPAYRFAKKFFETNWLSSGRGNYIEDLPATALGSALPYVFASQGSAGAEGVQIVPAAEPSGEVFFTAKEILKLVETQGFQFEDIAVLCRTLEPYQEEVRRVFAQNQIPLNASFSYPLAKFPLGIFCLNLLSLALNGFDRETVLSILSSPYFSAPQKQAWRVLAARSLANRDLNQWRDLLPHTTAYDPALLAWLERCQMQLSTLDQPRPWAQQAELALSFLKENINLTALHGKEVEIFETVCERISSLSLYARIRPESRPGEAVRQLIEVLSTLHFNEVENRRGGVTFTDVLRGRGLRFKVVFLLGLTEKSFPLLQPEDPILRDRYRYALRDVLGFWINQQAERADEERLLFFTAASAASNRLYACYPRAGIDGKETVPSVYLTELARACELDWKADAPAKISGRLSERIAAVPISFLTPKELSYAFILASKTDKELYQQAGLWSQDKERALKAAHILKQPGELTEMDGAVESGNEIFERTDQGSGFSPSALQELAACPMKYFFDKGLGLEEPEETYSRRELSPDRRGTAYHQILQDFYQELLRLGLTHQLFDAGVAEYMERAISKHYTSKSGQFFGIYPLIWELILEEIKQQLTAFAQEDIKNLGDYTPTLFEKEFSKIRVSSLPFALRGIIDRIDINKKDNTFIVADYKSSKKGGNDLAKAFFTHLIFQPFLYVLAAEKLPELEGYTSAGSCLLSIRKSYCRRGLPAAQFNALRPRAEQFLTQLVDLIKRGKFFLSPSELCSYCPYGAICRKDSFSCLMRARKSVFSRQLEEMKNG